MFIESLLDRVDLIQILSGVLIASLIAYISFRVKALSKSGAFGMIIIGSIVFGLGGIVFAVPLVVFFISSSLLSLIRSIRKEKSKLAFDKTGPRDLYQVLANGGVGALAVALYFLTDNIFWYFPFLASLSEAAADTWATELGTMSKKNPVSIATFKKVVPGQSGGVTLLGIWASIGGALVVMGAGYGVALFYDETILLSSLILFLASANAGFVGALFDSVLGGSLQAQHSCDICGRVTESKSHCGLPTEQISGVRYMNNDLVNFLSTLFAAVVITIIVLF